MCRPTGSSFSLQLGIHFGLGLQDWVSFLFGKFAFLSKFHVFEVRIYDFYHYRCDLHMNFRSISRTGSIFSDSHVPGLGGLLVRRAAHPLQNFKSLSSRGSTTTKTLKTKGSLGCAVILHTYKHKCKKWWTRGGPIFM